MSGPQFFETRMGQTFYQGTMPRIARSLEKIANVMETKLDKSNKKIPKDKLLLAVIEQIDYDLEKEDTTSIHELLSFLPDKNLIDYLEEK